MDERVRQKLAESLTADEPGIIPFLPYLLQDFWELGSLPEEMLATFREHIPLSGGTRVLDLACGKGAVSVRLAKELGIRFKGVDILPEFIDCARRKAEEYGVSELCEFVVGDVNLAVESERDYDCVVFGAVGDILGDHRDTVAKLCKTIRSGGFLLIDDAYAADEAVKERLQFERAYPTYDEWLRCFEDAGLALVECKPLAGQSPESVERDMAWISSRADELTAKYPAHRRMFEQYVANQRSEYNDLQNDLISAAWLLRKN